MTHLNTKQPEALRLADKYEVHGFMGDHHFAKDHWCSQAAAELRSLHTRVQELEASKEQRKPLTDEQILDELLGYHGYIHGYMPADCDWLDFARAIEAAHGITQENQHGE